MKKNKEKPGLSVELEQMIAANGQSMEHFYSLSTQERERVLETISKTNELMDKQTENHID